MRINRDPEFQVNFNRNEPREWFFRPWQSQPRQPPDPLRPPGRPPNANMDNHEPIPQPYCHFTVDKQMSSQNRADLIALPGTYNEKIRKYVRDRWPILGAFHDRTNSWKRCFLKCEY